MDRITLLLVDDHTLVREAWTFMLNNHPAFQVIGQCDTAEEAVQLAHRLRPAVVVLDISLPGMSGIEALPFIRKYAPGTKVLAVSLHTQPAYARQMMSQGAMGYITKDSPIAELITAITEVHHGRKYLCTRIRSILSEQEKQGPGGIHSLSRREMDIILRIKKGLSSREIARDLGLSPKTVEVHRYNILKKLKLKNSTALIDYMSRHQAYLAPPDTGEQPGRGDNQPT